MKPSTRSPAEQRPRDPRTRYELAGLHMLGLFSTLRAQIEAPAGTPRMLSRKAERAIIEWSANIENAEAMNAFIERFRGPFPKPTEDGTGIIEQVAPAEYDPAKAPWIKSQHIVLQGTTVESMAADMEHRQADSTEYYRVINCE
jgi:hypothetical protein